MREANDLFASFYPRPVSGISLEKSIETTDCRREVFPLDLDLDGGLLEGREFPEPDDACVEYREGSGFVACSAIRAGGLEEIVRRRTRSGGQHRGKRLRRLVALAEFAQRERSQPQELLRSLRCADRLDRGERHCRVVFGEFDAGLQLGDIEIRGAERGRGRKRGTRAGHIATFEGESRATQVVIRIRRLVEDTAFDHGGALIRSAVTVRSERSDRSEQAGEEQDAHRPRR